MLKGRPSFQPKFSPDGSYFAYGTSEDKRIQILDATNLSLVFQFDDSKGFGQIQFGPDNETVAFIKDSDPSTISLFDLKRGLVINHLSVLAVFRMLPVATFITSC